MQLPKKYVGYSLSCSGVLTNKKEFGFNLLVFESDNWQYMFSIDADVSHKVTPEILVQIANSIDF